MKYKLIKLDIYDESTNNLLKRICLDYPVIKRKKKSYINAAHLKEIEKILKRVRKNVVKYV